MHRTVKFTRHRVLLGDRDADVCEKGRFAGVLLTFPENGRTMQPVCFLFFEREKRREEARREETGRGENLSAGSTESRAVLTRHERGSKGQPLAKTGGLRKGHWRAFYHPAAQGSSEWGAGVRMPLRRGCYSG